MSRMNKVFGAKNYNTPVKEPDSVTTGEAFPAYSVNGKDAYLQMLMTNTLSNRFYASSNEQIEESIWLHELAIKRFPDFIGKAATYARNKGYMRTQPIMAMAYLANIKHKDFEKYFNLVILTPNDLVDFMIFLGKLRKGSQGGRTVKRTVGNWLSENLTDYWLVKYGSEDKKGYSLKDILITTHPKHMDDVYANYILHKTIGTNDDCIFWFNEFKLAKTSDKAVECVLKGKLPHEVVSYRCGEFPALWKALVESMPIFATLRNINTIIRHNAMTPEVEKIICERLTNKDIVLKSKILPFQILKAFENTNESSSRIKDAIRTMLELSMDNIPSIKGKSMIALDISGSMGRDNLKIGGILGISLAKKSDDNTFVLFESYLYDLNISKIDSTMTQVEQIKSDGGTNTYLVADRLIADASNRKRIADTIIILTDEQQNGTSVKQFYSNYRKFTDRYNKNAKLFVVDVNSYATSGKLAPSEDKNNYFIYGWSQNILSFIALASEGFDSMVSWIEQNM